MPKKRLLVEEQPKSETEEQLPKQTFLLPISGLPLFPPGTVLIALKDDERVTWQKHRERCFVKGAELVVNTTYSEGSLQVQVGKYLALCLSPERWSPADLEVKVVMGQREEFPPIEPRMLEWKRKKSAEYKARAAGTWVEREIEL